MKKTFYILTAILLLLTAMIPVSAIEEVEPQAACQHEYLLITYNTVYSFRNSTYHRAHTIRIAGCTSCGLKFESTVSLADEKHKKTIYMPSAMAQRRRITCGVMLVTRTSLKQYAVPTHRMGTVRVLSCLSG